MEDLADLTFASSSAIPTNSNGSKPSAKSGTSSFDYLSASIARPAYRPSLTQPSSQRPHSFQSSAASNSTQVNNSTDAFSSLFGDSSSSSAQPSRASSMTMAERLKAVETEKIRQLSVGTPVGMTLNSGTTSHLSHNLISSPQPLGGGKQSLTSAEPWDFDLLQTPSLISSRANSPGPSNHPTVSIQSLTQSNLNDDWDIDPLGDFNGLSNQNSLSHSGPILSPQNLPTNHAGSFNSLLGDEFGPLAVPVDQMNSMSLDDRSETEDDILGLLGAPVSQVNAIKVKNRSLAISQDPLPPQASSSRSRQASSDGNQLQIKSRSGSPPPHVLGQVVEMGFSPAQSREALFQTRGSSSGQWDVSAAVGRLVGQPTEVPPVPVQDSDPSSPEIFTSRPPSRSVNPTRSRSGRNEMASTPTLAGVNTREIQDQAAVLLAQASAYGTTALGRAASLWKQSKASITKVIEDQTSTSQTSKDGDEIKPKWMRDAPAVSPTNEMYPKYSTSASHRFSDERSKQESSHRKEPSSHSPELSRPKSSETRQPYVSSARRKVAQRTNRIVTPTQEADNLQSDGDLISPTKPAIDRSSKPLPRASLVPSHVFQSLPAVTVSQQYINQSTSYRTKGNEWFKQGQYANAEASYSQALASLQGFSGEAQNIYLGCLPLYNNRAASRLKNGDGKGAQDDVNKIIETVFCEDQKLDKSTEHLTKRLEWNQTRIPDELVGKIDIPEQVGKALSKRAKIKEDMEKWKEARFDWDSCRNLGAGVTKGAGGMKIVGEGILRCQKAITSSEITGSKPRPSAKPIATKPSTVNRNANVAVQKLRQANEQAESEANEKHELKDAIDLKISNWKNGKETNLRALIASLDQVLWEGLNWKKVGMGELLTEAQVKSKYVRAISKVHPDKIPKEASIAEQMIAKSVFATLNEAWISMQG